MLTIVLNWFYILVTVFCLGYAFAMFSEKVLHYSFKRIDAILMAGIVIATVYAQIFSLFYRVNIEANIVMLVVCFVICVIWRKQIVSFLRNAFWGASISYRILIPIVFLLWAYFTSRGYMVLDMDLYHGQSIRWIEEYGVVKGLGNLHGRFGYNSSIFAVSALYSMKFLFGRSMHAVNGFIAFVLSLEVLNLGKVFKRKRMLLSDYARVALFYYMSITWDEIIAPSSDYPVMFTIFFIVIKWLSALEREEETHSKNIAPYALLCVLGVQALTFKVTAGLILILLIKPAYMLLREKRWKEIGIYLALGLVVAVPWFTRNVLITGWLLYPFPALDLFNFDWKMTNVENIKTDAALIKVYAKAHNDLGLHASVGEWFPNWFATALYSMEKVFIIADFLAVVGVLGTTIYVFVKRNWAKLDVVLVLVTLSANYLFWQFSAPMTRYGYAHILLLAILTFGYFLENLNKKVLLGIVYAGTAVFLVYRVYAGIGLILKSCNGHYYVWPETYETYETESYKMGNVTIYYSPYGGVVGYDPFPAVPTKDDSVELRGEGLEDGFRLIGN